MTRQTHSDRPLAIELSVILAFKFAVLYLIWSLWFSHPEARHMTVTADRVSAHLLARPDAGKP